MQLKTISSLEKCFLDEGIDSKKEYKKATVLKNELFHFCVAYRSESGRVFAHLKLESEISDYINISRIESVPVRFAADPDFRDDFYLRDTPGLYPDLLQPLGQDNRLIVYTQTKALMAEVDVRPEIPAGKYPIRLSFETESETYSTEFELEIINAVLPFQSLIYTQWFYCDSLKDYYETEMFDDRHFEIIEAFVKNAVKYGVNMLLTPVFTPPLDTAVGCERETVQLVGVSLENGKYSFDFTLLDRWINMCDRVGVKYFEISHFFTQWGAKAAPKIMATVNGEYRRIFGWDTPADSAEYSDFLKKFIPKLISFMKSKNGADKRCFFHISDEPDDKLFEGYMRARNIVAPLLKGYPIIDALSSYDIYSAGAVTAPICSTYFIEKFLENGVEGLWAYNCMEGAGISNRFISMPSQRNRIIGIQLYKYNIKGYLHWGYNFYYNQFSKDFVNPFICTDGEYFTPSGDAFSVYPGRNGEPWNSLRLLVFSDALQDIRALTLCERIFGREYVENIIGEDAPNITFKNYPRSADYILETREKINAAIKYGTDCNNAQNVL